MNKKVLGLIAASITLFGTAISATPARANAQRDVDVEVNVAPALFLRTFDRVVINVTANGTEASTDTVPGGDVDTLTAQQLTQGGPGSLSSVQQITKEIPNLFAVWGNEGTVEVTVNPTPGNNILALQGTAPTGLANRARISNASVTFASANKNLDPEEAVVGGATVDIEFLRAAAGGSLTSANASAGQYTGGKLTVRAVQAP